MEHVSVVVCGADAICANCVDAPISKGIHDQLQLLLKRKYPNISFKYTCTGITKDNDNLTDHDLQFIEGIEQDELFYPLITMNDEYVADGYIQIEQIIRFIDQKLMNEQYIHN